MGQPSATTHLTQAQPTIATSWGNPSNGKCGKARSTKHQSSSASSLQGQNPGISTWCIPRVIRNQVSAHVLPGLPPYIPWSSFFQCSAKMYHDTPGCRCTCMSGTQISNDTAAPMNETNKNMLGKGCFPKAFLRMEKSHLRNAPRPPCGHAREHAEQRAQGVAQIVFKIAARVLPE